MCGDYDKFIQQNRPLQKALGLGTPEGDITLIRPDLYILAAQMMKSIWEQGVMLTGDGMLEPCATVIGFGGTGPMWLGQ